MLRFQRELDAINSAIAEFNRYLVADYRVPGFDLNTAVEQKAIVQVLHQTWNKFPFPNNGTPGVYFMFGHGRTHAEKNGLYIGKASLGKKTSDRLYAHLKRYRHAEHFLMNGRDGEPYIVDYIASVDLGSPDRICMGPALEEFLICRLRSELNLVNVTGNC